MENSETLSHENQGKEENWKRENRFPSQNTPLPSLVAASTFSRGRALTALLGLLGLHGVAATDRKKLGILVEATTVQDRQRASERPEDVSE